MDSKQKQAVAGQPKYVYVVTGHYDYEGESFEEVYATKALAKKHRSKGNDKIIYKVKIKTLLQR